jgi:peptide/nickel transport system substrate-binding protein
VAAQENARAPIIRMASGLGASTFDPVFAPPATIDYLRPCYDTLVNRRGIDKFEPGLAVAWQYSDGNRKLMLKLRDGVRFNDGAAFDADAVKLNLDRGRGAAGSPWADTYRAIENVEVLSANSVMLHLASPNPSLIESFASNPGMMVSPNALGDAAALAQKPVGIAPWTLDPAQTVRGERYVFSRNDAYWAPSAQPVETVIIQQMVDPTARVNALRGRQLDIATVPQEQASTLRKLGFKLIAQNKAYYLFAVWDAEGSAVPALRDIRVRRAMSLALNRDAILSVVFGGFGTATLNFYPEHTSGYSAALAAEKSYDPAAAKALLAEAGYPEGFDVTSMVQSNNARVAAVVAGELAKIGVRINLVTMPDVGSYLNALRQRKSPVGIFGLQTAQPFTVYSALLAPGARYNPFNTTDPELEALANKAAESSEAEAVSLYARLFEGIVAKRVLVFPVAYADIIAATRPGIVVGPPTYASAGLPDPRYLAFTKN